MELKTRHNTSYVDEEINIIADSSEILGAKNRNAIGSSFEIHLENPLRIPSSAKNVNVSVISSAIWNTAPNIVEGVNNKIYITKGVTTHIITFTTGLYGLDITASVSNSLNQAISRALEEIGGVETDLISIIADAPTNRSMIVFNYADVSIDFSQPESFHGILGFEAVSYGRAFLASPKYVLSPNIADMASVNYYLIQSDISQGLLFNNRFSNTVAQVLVDKAPNEQLQFKPINPAKVSADHLRGSLISKIKVSLTSEEGVLVDTRNESFSVHFLISYKVPAHQ